MSEKENRDPDESIYPRFADNSDFFRDIPNWISALQMYVKDTNVSCLNLRITRPDVRLPFEAVESILKFLPDSGVTELILNGIKFPQNIKNFCELLKKTKIEKLSTVFCFSSRSGLLDLAKVLNDTKITEWNAFTSNVDKSDRSDVVEERALVSCLLHSRLTKLTLTLDDHIYDQGALSFAKGLPNTFLTSLRLDFNGDKSRLSDNILVTLFSQLPLCKIKDLDLSLQCICYGLIKEFSRNLATSNVEKLNLESCGINDAGLDILAQGLVNSNVSILNVQHNNISGLNNFGHYLKNTKLKVLNLGGNFINHSKMFTFPNFLKDSLVEELDINRNCLSDEHVAELISSLKSSKVSSLNLQFSTNFGIRSLSELAVVLKETGLKDVNLSYIHPPLETFDILNGCVKKSMLQRIKFARVEECAVMSCLRFIEGTKNSSVLSIDIQSSCFLTRHAELFAGALMKSTFTHLNLSSTKLSDVFTGLAVNLKYTCITHLNLSYSNIQDEHIQLLAEHLIETKIVKLNLSGNFMSKKGVIALGCCPQTSVIYLWLTHCAIQNDGLEILAENFTGSLITFVNVEWNPGNRVLLIEKVLLENRVRSHKLLAFFKLVFPETSDKNFCFHQSIHDRDVSDFLEECLQFYKSAVEQPAVVSVLLEEKSLPFSRQELVDLLCNKFPLQFVKFISKWIEADISQQVKFLERAEELGLVKIVENLLLHRPLYTIDEAEGILHPCVYSLLLKYKQPICNVAVEPNGILKIIDYFTQHADIEGVADLVNLLTATKLT